MSSKTNQAIVGYGVHSVSKYPDAFEKVTTTEMGTAWYFTGVEEPNQLQIKFNQYKIDCNATAESVPRSWSKIGITLCHGRSNNGRRSYFGNHGVFKVYIAGRLRADVEDDWGEPVYTCTLGDIEEGD